MSQQKKKIQDFPASNDDLVAPTKTANDDEFEKELQHKPRMLDIKKRIKQMQEEASKIKALTTDKNSDNSDNNDNVHNNYNNYDYYENRNDNNYPDKHGSLYKFKKDSSQIKTLIDDLNRAQNEVEIDQKSNNGSINNDNNSNNNNNNKDSNNDKDSETPNTDQYPKTVEEQQEIDSRSIFVSMLDKASNASDVKKHFEVCGPIERITIVCEKYTGKPKGSAYIQFKAKESCEAALLLDGKQYNGAPIKVQQKRTNQPRWMRGRGRGYRGRYRGRGGRAPRGPSYYGYQPYFGRGYRGYGRGYFGPWAPY